MKALLSTIVLICLLAFPVMSQPGGNGYQIGDWVEDFTLPDNQGNDVSLSDYLHRIRFLALWSPY